MEGKTAFCENMLLHSVGPPSGFLKPFILLPCFTETTLVIRDRTDNLATIYLKLPEP